MVVVGGVTRLTHSGLSIVEWQPLIGALPPLTEAQWDEMFEKYKLTPEFRLRNHDMARRGVQVDLLVGVLPPPPRAPHRRGLLPAVPLFPAARPARPAARLEACGRVRAGRAAGGDGLVHGEERPRGRPAGKPVPAHRAPRPRAPHPRGQFWMAHAILRPAPPGAPAGAAPCGLALAVLVFAMALTGGLVAGIRAGYAYNTFPLMNGHWIPPEILMIEPWWLNFGYNMATVQFVHRTLALVVLAGAWTPRLARTRCARDERRIAARRRHARRRHAAAGDARHRDAADAGARRPRHRAPGRRRRRPHRRPLARKNPALTDFTGHLVLGRNDPCGRRPSC